MEHQTEPGWTGASSEHASSEHASGEHVVGQDVAGQDVAGQDVAGQDVAGRDAPGRDAPVQELGPEVPAFPAQPATGEPRVDAALKLLDRLPGLPVSDHPELFEQVHAQLSEVLDELESGSGTAGPAGG